MISLYKLNAYRLRDPEIIRKMGPGDDRGGIFMIPMPGVELPLRVIAGSGDGWDHVSVSRPDRCPTWEEMDFIKRLFFHADETVMQLHVPDDDHISYHPYCLHLLWRPLFAQIPRPPDWMVGPKQSEAAT